MKESTMKRIHFKADGTPYVNLTNLEERKRVAVDIADIEMLIESGLKHRQIAKLYSTTDSAISTALLCIRDYRANSQVAEPAPKASAKIFPLVIPKPKPANPFADCITFLEDGKFHGLETAKNFQKVMYEMGVGEYFYWKFHYAAFKKLSTCSPEEVVELLRMADKEKAGKVAAPKKMFA